MRRMMLSMAAASALAAGGARAQAAAPAGQPPAAEPAPAPDAARLWRGTVHYRVTINGDTTGADTATVRPEGGQLVASDRMHLMGTSTRVETRMALPSLAPVSSTGMQEAAGQRGEVGLAYEALRVRGTVALPGAAPAEIDAALPAGAYDLSGLAAVVMALPLRPGAAWTLQAYSPYVRQVAAVRVEVGAVETVETPMGPVRAYPVRLTGGPAEMRYWFSEAEPRWEVKGAIPAYGVTIEARSRAP